MKPDGTLIIKRHEIARLLTLDECIAAVEQAFKLNAVGQSLAPGVLESLRPDGGFHIKAAGLKLAGRTYFAAKVNGNFFHNIRRFGMPNIQGVIVLCDGENGYPLALMDSIEITILRTGAATAVAAKYLARPDSKVATVCGCGNQGRIQIRTLTRVLPLERVYAYDIDGAQADGFAHDLSAELQIEVKPVRDLLSAVGGSDICVTCTPSRHSFLKREHVKAGTFIAAVGADNPLKQELDPDLMVSNKIVVDILEQCAKIGDLRHALEKGVLTRADVHAELGEIVAGQKPGRTSEEEITIFDSTGTALQDVAAAAIVYEKAAGAGIGIRLNLTE